QTFAGDPIYRDGAGVAREEVERRVEAWWRPYHGRIADALAQIRQEHGFALLWDAHSIRGEVPRLFEGRLPELNFGTNDGKSCPDTVLRRIMEAAAQLPYSTVANQRFKGGYITRHYGRPDEGVHAVQLEIAQRCYMDESTLGYDELRAGQLSRAIETLLRLYVNAIRHIES
ncbi:MAG TPA: N-formylglutamate amidohydrolase, partial [Woeseiaceae bacterium]|nr:N-formylglutamate amidohydrolase [Woeseiaceae bacterium]